MAPEGRASAVGIADLVEAVRHLAGDSVDARLRIARVLGFALKGDRVRAELPEPPPPPPSQPEPPPPEPPPPEPKPLKPGEDPLRDARLLPVVGTVDLWQGWAKDVEGSSLCRPKAVGPGARPSRPLLPPAQLREIVIQLSATDCGKGAVDLRRLLQSVAKGEPVRALPHLKRRSLRRGVQLIVDIGEGMLPFFRDVIELRDAFRRYVGAAHVDVVKVDGSPDRVCAQARGAPDYRPPPRGVPVVVLGDLGAGQDFRAPGAFSTAWWNRAKLLAAQHTPLRALVPAYSHLAGVDAPAGLTLVPWRPETTAGVVRRAIRGGGLRMPAGALPDIDAAERLKPLLAPAVRVEPGLVRRMRQHVPVAGVGAEAALWFGDEVMDASPSGFRFLPAEREALLQSLEKQPRRLRVEARECMAGQHEGMPPVLRLEEEATWELVEHSPERAAQYFKPALAAMLGNESRRAGLTHWSREAVTGMPRSLREAHGLEWMRVIRWLHTGSRTVDEKGRRRVGIRVTWDRLELGALTPVAGEAILVVVDSPSVYVQIGNGEVRRHALVPGARLSIRLDAPGAITLWNAWGEVFRPERPEPPRRDVKLRQIKVMISSTRADLMQYRQVAVEVLNELQNTFRKRLQIVLIGMETEDQNGDDARPVAKSKEWVEASDWVVLIVGRHYGTITDELGADGLSVTEWEYRHARALEKKVFVFLSGLMGSSDPYDGQGDIENLVNWTDVQTDAQAAGLKAFRKTLEERVSALFRNARHFEQLLRRTLMRWTVVGPGPDLSNYALRELLIRLQPKIKPCYLGVKQLYHSKAIYDAIHQLRQRALVPLHDRVERKRKGAVIGLTELVKEAKMFLGTVTARSRELDDDEVSARLKWAINRMAEEVNELRAADPTTDQPLPVEEIGEQLDECFRRLEVALEAANTAMQQRKGAFADLHAAMTWALEMEKSKLNPTEQAELQREITLTTANRDRLVTTLGTHDAWQRIHSEIVRATNTTRSPETTRRKCVESEAEPLKRSIEQIQAQARRDDEDITVLEKEFDKLVEAQQHLLALSETAPTSEHAEAWHCFYLAFDDCFFKVDKRTLAIVGLAKERVEEMEESFKREGINGSDE